MIQALVFVMVKPVGIRQSRLCFENGHLFKINVISVSLKVKIELLWRHWWRGDTHQNAIQCHVTKHEQRSALAWSVSILIVDILSIAFILLCLVSLCWVSLCCESMLSVFMLSVIMLSGYTECHHADCRYAECHYAVWLCWVSLC